MYISTLQSHPHHPATISSCSFFGQLHKPQIPVGLKGQQKSGLVLARALHSARFVFPQPEEGEGLSRLSSTWIIRLVGWKKWQTRLSVCPSSSAVTWVNWHCCLVALGETHPQLPAQELSGTLAQAPGHLPWTSFWGSEGVEGLPLAAGCSSSCAAVIYCGNSVIKWRRLHALNASKVKQWWVVNSLSCLCLDSTKCLTKAGIWWQQCEQQIAHSHRAGFSKHMSYVCHIPSALGALA